RAPSAPREPSTGRQPRGLTHNTPRAIVAAESSLMARDMPVASTSSLEFAHVRWRVAVQRSSQLAGASHESHGDVETVGMIDVTRVVHAVARTRLTSSAAAVSRNT